jgi:hypothetical protein
MHHHAGWAIGIIFLIAQVAAGQTPDPEKILPPLGPGIKSEAPASEGTMVIPFDAPRRAARFYADADYLLWRVNNGPAPILLTTAPNNGLNANGLTGGILGQPGTTALFSGHDLDFGIFSGLRVKVGVNLGVEDFWAFEAGGFYLSRRSVNFNRTSNPDGTPLLTTPFLDASTGLQQSLDISSQDINGNPILFGSISIRSEIKVWGYEFNAIAHSIRTADRSIDLFVGFRSLHLEETLNIDQSVTALTDNFIFLQSPTVGQGTAFGVAANSPVFISDSFRTHNDFYGGQIGSKFTWDLGPFTADMTAKVALGVTHQQVSINGSSTATVALDPNTNAAVPNLTTPGGVFALQNNIGNFTQNQFTVVPEIGLNLQYAVTSWLKLHVGYSAVYWSNVARPGAQIDTVLNSKLIPTGALLGTTFMPGQEQGRPFFAFRDTAFWAYGVNFGMEFRY